jgi:hypothetical protein
VLSGAGARAVRRACEEEFGISLSSNADVFLALLTGNFEGGDLAAILVALGC